MQGALKVNQGWPVSSSMQSILRHIRNFVWGKQNPVGGVHVMGTPAIITGVFAQLQELLDVEVPGLQVDTDRALALPSLVDVHNDIVGDFEEGDHSLGLTVGAFDMSSHGAHRRPAIVQATSPLTEHRVIAPRLGDVVRNGGQIAV